MKQIKLSTVVAVAAVIILAVYGVSVVKNFVRVENRRMGIGEPLQPVLQNAYMVEIEYNVDKQDWRGFYDGTTIDSAGSQWQVLGIANNTFDDRDERTNPSILALLRSCKGFHSTAPPPQDRGFVFFFRHGQEIDTPRHAFVYIPQTGELGRGHDWCYVPARFKTWMQAQPLYHPNLPSDETSAPDTLVVTPQKR